MNYKESDGKLIGKLAVTYTFGLGKKVERGDEVSQQSDVNSHLRSFVIP